LLYRKSQIRDRQRDMNRLHKVMQDTVIKLDCVATDTMGRSGRAMLDALVCATTDPRVLADLARGLLRKKLPALQAALEGRFDAEHALVVGRILAHIDYLDEAVGESWGVPAPLSTKCCNRASIQLGFRPEIDLRTDRGRQHLLDAFRTFIAEVGDRNLQDLARVFLAVVASRNARTRAGS
jgi:hypothetical protein